MPASKLLNYPHGAFLMLRLEFVVICQEEELEAMLLRIIEKHVENKRQSLFSEAVNKSKGSNDQVIEIERDLWVPISHKLFMNDLYGIVTSENTIKKALKSLEKKRFIFSRFNPKRRYDAPEYRLHIPVIQSLLDVVGKSGYQILIPSIIDTLKNLDPQELTLSGCQKLIASCQLRVSKSAPNIRKGPDDNKSNKKTEDRDDPPTSPTSNDPSFSLSSNSHVSSTGESPPPVAVENQGGVTLPPASVKGGSSPDDESGAPNRTDALLIARQNGIEPTIEASGSQDYTKPELEQPCVTPMEGLNRVTQESKPVQTPLLDAPLAEPDMSGSWTAEKCVQYAEYCNGKRYTEKQRKAQIEAARAIHRDDGSITLIQFKQAYDECCRDGWWRREVGDLHVSHMKANVGKSGISRIHTMLRNIERSRKVVPIRPVNDISEEAIERARQNNQKAKEKIDRILAEKRAKEARKGNSNGISGQNSSSVVASAKATGYVGVQAR